MGLNEEYITGVLNLEKMQAFCRTSGENHETSADFATVEADIGKEQNTNIVLLRK